MGVQHAVRPEAFGQYVTRHTRTLDLPGFVGCATAKICAAGPCARADTPQARARRNAPRPDCAPTRTPRCDAQVCRRPVEARPGPGPHARARRADRRSRSTGGVRRRL
eukprot:3216814-Prymnesium_polylepis.1